MEHIRYLVRRDLDDSRFQDRYQMTPGLVMLHHLDGPPTAYRLAQWCKNIGDRVSSGEIIAKIETDQFTMEVEAFEKGTLVECLFELGAHIPDGAILARIDLDATPQPAAS